MAYLVLVRHTESVWNALGLWTGWTDVSIDEKGRTEAKKTANQLKDIHFDLAYTSKLRRTRETLDIIKDALEQKDIPTYETAAINERDYGILTGKNKWEVKKQVGDKEFDRIHRSWNFRPTKGESLKDVYNRFVPFYKQTILPQLKSGKNIILTAHGNSLRALEKFLDNLTNKQVEELEIGIGEAHVYQINPHGKILSKQTRTP